MIDIENLRQNPTPYKASMEKRNMDPSAIDRFIDVDTKWRSALQTIEAMRNEQKALGAEKKIDEAKAIKEKIQSATEELRTLENERMAICWSIPNLILEDVPVGHDETENKILRTWGEPTKFTFKPRDHVELGKLHKLIDNERASKVSGARFTYLTGPSAQLQLAIMNFVFDTLTNPKIIRRIADKIEKGYSPKPFTPVFPPAMIKADTYARAGRLNNENKDDKFYIEKDDLYLTGSAEHTLVSMFMDEQILAKDLPVRLLGYSTNFRREAGSYGKDTRGILRMHQFDKLEMESFTAPENSPKEQDFFVAIQEYLMQQLKLPYQVVAICTGDMTASDARQIDIETWMPGQDKYRETHTADLMTDYQTRRLNTKIKLEDGKTAFAHTNDATAFAIGRILIAILENNQTEQGSINIPRVLHKYLPFKKIG